MTAKKKKQSKHAAPYDTFALAEDYKRDRDINVTIPSQANVRQAKEWVDENKK